MEKSKKPGAKGVSFDLPEPATKQPAEKKPPRPARKLPQNAPMFVDTKFAFLIFFVAHIVAAIYSPIQDCDEVFNFWEPTHYLNYGYGLQTWEYSPEFAIRSWAYASLHGIFTGIGRLVPFTGTKAFQFYFLRGVLGTVCAVAESRLYAKMSQILNPRIGAIFLVIMLTSPGMFHASVSYLPSTFAMYTTMLGIAHFMDWRGGIRTAGGIFWMGTGSVLGWPFAGVLVLPFVGEELLLFSVGAADGHETVQRFMYGFTRTLLLAVFLLGIDCFFYRKIALVPFNIVWYNIISTAQGKGPNIYGTEPWHFYIRNLTLNFNIWFLLAFAALPLVILQEFIRRRPVSKQSYIRMITFVIPFYIWMAIFTFQPHKEERFMYPIYPALAMNAAVTLHILLMLLGSTGPRAIMSAVPAKVRFAGVGVIVLGSIVLSLLRTVGIVTAYDAPLSVYKPLHEPGVAKPGHNVCLGKEWYRFPGNFHLPVGVKPKFVKSAFSGLMPGEFRQASTGFGIFPGAYLIPSGMNDENIEDLTKYTDIARCDFLVDSSFPGLTSHPLEPDYVHDTKIWEKVQCEPFLDTSRTSVLGRLIWVPNWSFIPAQYQRKWGEYCLLRRKKT